VHTAWGHYMTLAVPHDFTPEELKKAYRVMSLRLHPDKHGGSDVGFSKVALAHETLADAAKRRVYDEGEDLHSTGSREPTTRKVVERKYFPGKHGFEPFGDDHHKTRRQHIDELQEQQSADSQSLEQSANEDDPGDDTFTTQSDSEEGDGGEASSSEEDEADRKISDQTPQSDQLRDEM